MKTLRAILLRLLGGVSKKQLESVKAELTTCREALEQSQQGASDFKDSNARLNRVISGMSALEKKREEMSSQQWTQFQLAAFPSTPHVPDQIQSTTLNNAKKFVNGLRGISGLSRPEVFSGKPVVGAFYWSFATAGAAASQIGKEYKREDRLSGVFIDALIAKNKQCEITQQFGVGVNRIFDNNLPNLKEGLVGADFLLAVAGEGLIQGGGVRLFWVQAKVCAPAKAYELDVYREPGKSGGAQLDALRKMHRCEQGSIGVYASFSPERTFSVALPVEALSDVDASDREKCKVSLEKQKYASRSQELFTALATAPNEVIGAFRDVNELLDFLTNAVGDAIVTFEGVSMTASPSTRDLDLIRTVDDYYRERLDEYHAKVIKGEAPKRNVDRSPKPPGLDR